MVMRMGYNLNVIQTQKLIMTPELRQAIAVLQLSSLELDNYIQQQIQENPLLEIKDDDAETDSAAEKEQEQAAEEGQVEEYDLDWQQYFSDSSDLGFSRGEINREKSDFNYEHVVSRSLSLAEHLILQLQLSACPKYYYAIAEYIIGNLDYNGYLNDTVNEMAARLGVDPDDVQAALEIVQSFEPAGVGARSLRECLLLQMAQLELGKDALVRQMVEHHIQDLADGKYTRLSQLFGVPVTEIQRAADLIKTMDPKPGRNFDVEISNRYIYPDVVLEKIDREYIVMVNDALAPRLTINAAYRSVLSQEKSDQRTKKYVEGKLNAAAWLIKSIEQRRLTLYKVTECLVQLQRDFLDYGIKYLKPLNLKTVADLVDLHESTVSRATSNKYIQTPRGVFELKYFFSSGLAGIGGGSVSAESTRKIMQEIIETENPYKPYNDQQVADLLGRRGITISRRTVAKYRDELGILSFRKRKRY